jgi:hypothetical protein
MSKLNRGQPFLNMVERRPGFQIQLPPGGPILNTPKETAPENTLSSTESVQPEAPQETVQVESNSAEAAKTDKKRRRPLVSNVRRGKLSANTLLGE